MDIPFSYDYSNAIGSTCNPSGVVTDVKSAKFYRRYLLQKAMSVFKWDLPENWSKDYFLYTLYCTGRVAVIDTKKYGVIPQQCGLAGYNVFYQPREVIIANPLLRIPRKPVIDIDCVVFKLAPDYGSIMDLVNYYSQMMALVSETMAVNVINSKLSYVFAVDNQQSAEAIKKAGDNLMSGKPFVVLDKKLFRDDGKVGMPFMENNLRNSYIANDLQITLDNLENSFAQDIGLPNANTDKKERMITDEVNANKLETFSRADMWLDGWKDSCRKIYDMFGVEISVDWRKGAGSDETSNTFDSGAV